MMHHIWFLMQLGWNTSDVSDVHLWRGVPFDRLQTHLCQHPSSIGRDPQLFASERSKHLVFLEDIRSATGGRAI